MTDDRGALPPALADEIATLSRRFRRANGPVMAVLNRLGGGLEKQLHLLPASLRAQIGKATEAALLQAWNLAAGAGQRLHGPGPEVALAAALFTGAAGGAGGIATSVLELPVTVTLILHAVRAEAVAAGLDPAQPEIRAEALHVFAAGSPLARDDGIDTAFLSAKLTLTGPALHALIAGIAPKLAAAMTRKLAAQAVPVLGALSGAALNAAYLRYYREIAAIRFALLRLGRVHGEEEVLAAFRLAASPPPINRA